jgi:hypothetical protein
VKLRFSAVTYALLLTQSFVAYSQVSKDQINEYLSSCQKIQFVVAVRDRDPALNGDEFEIASRSCVHFQDAVKSADAAKINVEADKIRPIMADMGLPPVTEREQFEAQERKAAKLRGRERFYELNALAKRAFNAGEIEKSKQYADELLNLARNYPKDWNYGNAIYDGNLVLGRIALKRGDVKLAGKYLLSAGKTPGSPQLNTFGPNLTLAQELLAQGERESVLKFFGLCKHFWEMDGGKLDKWSAEIRAGKVPEIKVNLNY